MSNPQPFARQWANILAGASALARAPLLKLFRSEPDCWRRTIGLGLRSEGARFALASFNLRMPPDVDSSLSNEPANRDLLDRFIRHFARFLVKESDAHFILKHHPYHVERMASPRVDLGQCDFSPAGELLATQPHLDSREPATLDSVTRQEIENIVLLAHGSTRHLSDIIRFQKLESLVQQQIASHAGARDKNERLAYARRLLTACAVSLEAMPAGPCARFLPPDFRQHRGFGAGSFDVVLRPAGDGCMDLWLNIHHTAADGAPMQEMLTRLEAAWGIGAPIYFPADDSGRAPFIQNCQTSPADRPISVLVDFLDFTSLTRSRVALNRKLASRLESPVPLAAMVLWSLAHEPEFADKKFATAVDVPLDKHWPRAVDLVAIRPADYFKRPDGFRAFVHDFINLVKIGQGRRSPTYSAMRALSCVAPRFAAKALAANPDRTRAVFGTAGLSILKDAKVFVAPMADAGWDDGFIALGNLSLPAGDGRTTGVLTIKGSPERIAQCGSAFRHALSKADTFFENIADGISA
jgi:hypothetical protein